MAQAPLPDDTAAALLDHLERHLPGYPFDPAVDGAFVDELLDDFADLDVLAQIGRFRWCYANRPPADVRRARRGLASLPIPIADSRANSQSAALPDSRQRGAVTADQ